MYAGKKYADQIPVNQTFINQNVDVNTVNQPMINQVVGSGKNEISESRTVYASRVLRLSAAMLDWLIVGFLTFFFLAPFYFFDFLSILIGQMLVYLMPVLYSIFLVKLRNATLAKQFFGLEVKSEYGRELTWLQVILREFIGKILSSFWLLGFIWIFFDKKRQGWHDKIAKTVVVQVKEISKVKRVMAWFFVFISSILPILGIIAVIILFFINPYAKIRKNMETEQELRMIQQQKQKEMNLLFNTITPTETR
ncbi:MAG: RDD family protein [Patescibacteria group bacterium]|nr:RDD family protein [Patescibacteria group bacterium]